MDVENSSSNQAETTPLVNGSDGGAAKAPHAAQQAAARAAADDAKQQGSEHMLQSMAGSGLLGVLRLDRDAVRNASDTLQHM